MKRILSLLLVSSALFSYSSHAQILKINTVAGTGTEGFSGDGGIGTAAQLHGPLSVAGDNAGNVYVADYYNRRVRKIMASGEIITVAGNGAGGNSGDGSIATSATLFPRAVATDAHGNLYIADADNNVIRKVNSLGTISTYAGSGTAGFSGDGGTALSAQFSKPYGVAVDDAGNLFIADAGNHCIRKVDTGGNVSTVAGRQVAGYTGDNGPADSATLDSPYAVACDHKGNIYIADYMNNVIRRVTNDTITTYAGNGTAGYFGNAVSAIFALLNHPTSVATDKKNNVYLAEAGNNVVRLIDTTQVIYLVAGNGSRGFGGDMGFANGANLDNPYGVTVDTAGNVYIADANNQRVRKTYVFTLGVANIQAAASIAAYPNPFSNVVTISGLGNGGHICVYDAAGRIVAVADPASATWAFDAYGLDPGVYLVQVSNSAGSQVQAIRLIKN